MAASNIKILDSLEDLQEEIRQQTADLKGKENVDFFYTLPWFENLFLHGLEPAQSEVVTGKFLLARDLSTNYLVCLPLLSGEKLTGLSNYYSSLYGPLSWSPKTSHEGVQDPDPSLWHAIGKRLRQDRANWPVITFSPLDEQAPFFTQMFTALGRAGYWVDSFFCFGNWYLDVANQKFSAYFLTLPSLLRHNVERGQRRLSRHGAWCIDILQSPGPILEAAIDDFVHVYNQSWKTPEPNVLFIPNLIRMAAGQGWLRLGILRLNGQAIAAQLWLVKGQKASIYKLAYDKSFERFSAGSVLTHEMMKSVIDIDQVLEVDYLTGDDAYKQDWMSHRRERRGIVAFHPGTWPGIWQACKHFGGRQLKRRRLV